PPPPRPQRHPQRLQRHPHHHRLRPHPPPEHRPPPPLHARGVLHLALLLRRLHHQPHPPPQRRHALHGRGVGAAGVLLHPHHAHHSRGRHRAARHHHPAQWAEDARGAAPCHLPLDISPVALRVGQRRGGVPFPLPMVSVD